VFQEIYRRKNAGRRREPYRMHRCVHNSSHLQPENVAPPCAGTKRRYSYTETVASTAVAGGRDKTRKGTETPPENNNNNKINIQIQKDQCNVTS
jgi:hypothetical protein